MNGSMSLETKPQSVCYVGGIGRSGSTILDLLLSQSPEIFGVGQLAALHLKSDDQCSCGEDVQHCEYWGIVLEQLGEQGLAEWQDVHQLIFHEKNILRFLFSKDTARRLSAVSDNVYELSLIHI